MMVKAVKNDRIRVFAVSMVFREPPLPKDVISNWMASNEHHDWGLHWTVSDYPMQAQTRRIRFDFTIRKKPNGLPSNEGFIPLPVQTKYRTEGHELGFIILNSDVNERRIRWTNFYPWLFPHGEKPGGLGTLAHWVVKNYLCNKYPGHESFHAQTAEDDRKDHLSDLGLDGLNHRLDDHYSQSVDRRVAQLIQEHSGSAFAI